MISGWITAFCFWDQHGKMLYRMGNGSRDPSRLLDDVSYHQVEIEQIPSGCTSVPVTVDDNGTIYKTVMVAGSVGVRVTSSGEMLDESNVPHRGHSGRFERGQWVPVDHKPPPPTGEPGLDSLQPESGWYVLLFAILIAIFILQKLHVKPSLLWFAIESLRVVHTQSKSCENCYFFSYCRNMIVSLNLHIYHSCVQLRRTIGGCMTHLKIPKQQRTRKRPYFMIQARDRVQLNTGTVPSERTRCLQREIGLRKSSHQEMEDDVLETTL